MTSGHLNIWRIGFVRDLGRIIQQIKHLGHINKRLADFPIHSAQKIQRHCNLDHISGHHNEIANTQTAVLHTHRCHNHHCGKPKRD